MQNIISTFFIALSFCISVLPTVCFASGEIPASKKMEQANSSTATKDTPHTSFVHLYNWAGALPKDLAALKAVINDDNIESSITSKLPKLAADIHDLQRDITMTQTKDYLEKINSDLFEQELSRLEEKITALDKSLTITVSQLSILQEEWNTNNSKLAEITKQYTLDTMQVSDQLKTLKPIVDEAIKLIDVHLESAFIAGKELHSLDSKLQSINEELSKINKRIIKDRTKRNSTTVLTTDFYTQISMETFVKTSTNIKEFVSLRYRSLKDNFHSVFVGSLLFLILFGYIYHSKNLVIASSRWYPFAISPFNTAIFATTAGFLVLDRLPYLQFVNQWDKILTILTLLSLPRLIKNRIEDKWGQNIFCQLSLFMAITTLLAMLKIPQSLMLLFVLGSSLTIFTLYLRNFLANRKTVTNQNPIQKLIRNSWGAIPALVIALGFLGYETLSILIFSTLISIASCILISWMLFHLSCGFLELLLKISMFSLLRDNNAVLVKNIQPFLAISYTFLAAVVCSVILDIYPSVDVAIKGFNNTGVEIFGLRISLMFLLTIYIVFYGALLFSRAVQALLITEILPRYNTGKGAQISINRLVHYAILTIGFFIMLNVLGFELKQLTILGGALGVGIGFGLQAIVNNFVSGLILLFERPVKIGDTIQVATEYGEVKEIGLRATIIQTFDNSEIVIPNADLVTGQVTNWTLAERKVRLKLPVGVAYGTDVTKVLEVLQECAESHPMVLNTPKATTLFLAFGASSLDFELRVWIPEFLDKMTAVSELNQSIESEFALHDIEIPFMQADLHIRSVDAASLKVINEEKVTQKNTKDESSMVGFPNASHSL